jgi:hypothetical protein
LSIRAREHDVLLEAAHHVDAGVADLDLPEVRRPRVKADLRPASFARYSVSETPPISCAIPASACLRANGSSFA